MLLARFVLCLAPVALAADAFAAVPTAPVTAALTFGSAPAVVGLVNVPGMVFCSGALIAPRLVLTAAHCLVQDGVRRWPHAVYAGADVRLGGAYLRVQGGEIHPAFDPFLHTADLAVLRLADVEDALTPLTIARSAPALHDPVRLVGFGASDEGPAGRQHTHTGAVINLARDFFRFAPGTCQGDSGGPVLANAPGKQGIAGVVSMSDASCTTGRAVSLADYAPWLTTTTARLDPPACRGGDGRCGAACPLGDTDCPCREDGACQLCAGADPDCSDSCVSDGACVAECLAPDPDCHTGVDGAMCTSDAECETAFCASGRCRLRCGGDGVTCAPWQRCAPLDGGSGGACVAIAAPPGGCAIAGATSSVFGPRGAPALLALLAAVAAALGARGRRPSVFRPKQSTPTHTSPNSGGSSCTRSDRRQPSGSPSSLLASLPAAPSAATPPRKRTPSTTASASSPPSSSPTARTKQASRACSR